MRDSRLGLAMASVAAGALFLPALAGASPSTPPRVREAGPTASLSSATAPAASTPSRLRRCAYPPNRAVLSIRVGDNIHRRRARVTFRGRLHRGTCGLQGERVVLVNARTGRVAGSDFTGRNGR